MMPSIKRARYVNLELLVVRYDFCDSSKHRVKRYNGVNFWVMNVGLHLLVQIFTCQQKSLVVRSC